MFLTDVIKFKELDYKKDEVLPIHNHQEGQILFARKGTMEVTAASQLIIAPASRIVWVPPKVEHGIKFRTDTKMRTAFIVPDILEITFKHICVFQATRLFREILIRLAEGKLNDHSFKEMLEFSLIKELSILRNEPFSIKYPKDMRARRVANYLLEDPSNTMKINEWANIAACSSKTLSRLFIKETDMTFQAWRRHLRLLLVHELLANGLSITEAAHEIGFATSSALAEAHRLTFGFPPTKINTR